ncbi:MAG: sigma-70 family RNA polymerase sigma factor, partial [Ruminococcus sp.]|nr:sigma-70 family RNA polymerase sigma factor [Candidatus Copronaster equi]
MDNGASSYRRFLEGDSNGFVEIVRDYKDGLILYINSFVNNYYVAEELTEDVFVKLGIKKPRFSEKASFKTWLYTIGRNLAIDYLRKQSKRKTISLESGLDISDYQSLED